MHGSELRAVIAATCQTLEGGGQLDSTHVSRGCPEEAPIPPTNLFDGAYDLTFLMGQGAIGEVWRARNVNLDKEVAIKLVKLEIGDLSVHARLRNEARLAAKINHPNVVGVYDTGIAGDGRYYLVMELLEGLDLREVLEQRQRVPAIEAVQMLLPVLAGLDCAHRQKIVHRDIKPDNIFLARSEDTIVPKLIDFGIALAADRASATRSTRTGALIGTPFYMAPEQARGALDLDERTDIWAIATVLYELIAGYVPFASDDLQEVLTRIDSAPAPPIEESLCDSELAAILNRGLAKDRAERWTGVREMASALITWLVARGVTEDISGDLLQTSWRSGSYRPPRVSTLRPSVGPPQMAPPVALNVAATSPGRPPLSRSRWSIALAAFGALVLTLFAWNESLPTRAADVSPSAADTTVTPGDNRTPPPVEVVPPAPLPEPPKTESRERLTLNDTQKSDDAAATATPAPGLVPETPAAPKTQKRRTAPSRDAGEDVPSASPSETSAPEERVSQVDPTWGF